MTPHATQSASAAAALAILADARARLAALDFPYGCPFRGYEVEHLVPPEADLELLPLIEPEPMVGAVDDAASQRNDYERKAA